MENSVLSPNVTVEEGARVQLLRPDARGDAWKPGAVVEYAIVGENCRDRAPTASVGGTSGGLTAPERPGA